MHLLTTKAKDLAIDPEDWPRCARCDMPVEKFCVTDTGDALYLVAACHEKVQMVEVPDAIWDNVIQMFDVEIGPAFSEGDNNEYHGN